MSENFDPYREALVVETKTLWPAELASTPAADRQRIEAALHADAQHAAQLEYVRLHAGFCRKITVTSADVDRVRQAFA